MKLLGNRGHDPAFNRATGTLVNHENQQTPRPRHSNIEERLDVVTVNIFNANDDYDLTLHPFERVDGGESDAAWLNVQVSRAVNYGNAGQRFDIMENRILQTICRQQYDTLGLDTITDQATYRIL